MFFEHKTIILE